MRGNLTARKNCPLIKTKKLRTVKRVTYDRSENYDHANHNKSCERRYVQQKTVRKKQEQLILKNV